MADLDPIVRPFLIAWFAFFGACIGSFLNVAVYRLPLRKSLSNPPSHCPKCGHPIRWYDNVPVFGWIMLGGKCRDCKAPISIRYPVVEAICGAVFGMTAAAVLQFYTKISLTEFFLWTSVFAGSAAILTAAALIQYDKFRR
ncbi:MAG: prepilin peptidase [Planctomycetaceae bacterium]|jgi:leader peptidase (prepilin peptidase)/N-methyltransferase|nr:prepilin peptidase [Planctomycetaceae bacterium]